MRWIFYYGLRFGAGICNSFQSMVFKIKIWLQKYAKNSKIIILMCIKNALILFF